jgi:hypothetical protein
MKHPFDYPIASVLVSASLCASNLESLHAPGPTADYPEKMALYGRLVGSWELENADYMPDGTTQKGRGEWHFGWVLDGRAIQDVYIVPKRSERRPDATSGVRPRYGSTMRFYDPRIDAWRIVWMNPVNGAVLQLTGRASGADIVQTGTDATDGSMVRWSFVDVTADSFRWVGETSNDRGKSWRKEQEMWARRVAAHGQP